MLQSVGKILAKVLLVFICLVTSVESITVNTYIPPNALIYLPLVKIETDRIMPDLVFPQYIPALIEQESCISLTHSKCWNPASRLKTTREEGAGLSQLTKAYNKDGTIRFDTLTELSRRYNDELKELSWSNVYSRPDLQIRAALLLISYNYKSLSIIDSEYERIAMTDSAYNGGLSGLNRERRVCGLAKGCDPKVWFDNVENYCMKSKRVIYGARNACDINREHTTTTLKLRMDKYKSLMQ